jgi:hypothetical protein|tara:strand:+ start:752 stop:1078 length:327 start_codon:yes stop_codon:yes gene_type:complete
MYKFLTPPTIGTAVRSLRPTSDFMVRGNELEWLDSSQVKPTQSEIDTELARLQAEYDAQDYARNREIAYPQLKEFAEAYTEKEIGGDDTKWNEYVTKYNKVRTDNPKG